MVHTSLGSRQQAVPPRKPYVSIAQLIPEALAYIPPERLMMTSDLGFGREGLSRRIAYDTGVSLVEGTNMVRRELSLSEAQGRGRSDALLRQRR
jgi:5-methyltetrahydropteroyltriglutamate--homocysteine methyltransferase